MNRGRFACIARTHQTGLLLEVVNAIRKRFVRTQPSHSRIVDASSSTPTIIDASSIICIHVLYNCHIGPLEMHMLDLICLLLSRVYESNPISFAALLVNYHLFFNYDLHYVWFSFEKGNNVALDSTTSMDV